MNKELRDAYEKGSGTVQAVMRASMAISAVMDSNLDRSIKVDTLMAIMKSLVCDIEIATVMRILDVSEKTNAPADVVMSKLAMVRLDESEALGRRVANLMDLFVEELDRPKVLQS